jgi:hypothetical protein
MTSHTYFYLILARSALLALTLSALFVTLSDVWFGLAEPFAWPGMICAVLLLVCEEAVIEERRRHPEVATDD